MSDATETIERYYEALSAGDIDRLLRMYGEGAEIVRYDGVADTPDEMRAYFEQHLARNPGFSFNQVVEVRQADDVLMWDALVDTDNGIVQMFHVVLIGPDGRFRRHIPGMRGFWGG